MRCSLLDSAGLREMVKSGLFFSQGCLTAADSGLSEFCRWEERKDWLVFCLTRWASHVSTGRTTYMQHYQPTLRFVQQAHSLAPWTCALPIYPSNLQGKPGRICPLEHQSKQVFTDRYRLHSKICSVDSLESFQVSECSLSVESTQHVLLCRVNGPKLEVKARGRDAGQIMNCSSLSVEMEASWPADAATHALTDSYVGGQLGSCGGCPPMPGGGKLKPAGPLKGSCRKGGWGEET